MPSGQSDVSGLGIQDAIRADAEKYKIPAALALAVAEQESAFDPTAINPKSQATGIFQLLPDTAKRLKVDPSNPRQNIDGGVRYLKELLDQHNGDYRAALATYGGVVTDTEYVPAVEKRIARYQLLAKSRTARAAAQAPSTAVGAQPASTPLPPGAALPGATPSMIADAPGSKPGTANQPASFWDVERMYLGDFFAGLDPRTSEGRRNILSLGAEGAATALAGPRAGTMVRVGAPAAAAAVTGGVETAAENALGTGTGENAIGAGLAQGAYSVGGYAMAWPIRTFGKIANFGWFPGGSVGANAKAAIEGGVTRASEMVDKTTAAGKAMVQAARQQAAESLEAARILASSTVETIKAEGRDALAKLGTKTAATRAAAAAGQPAVEAVKKASYDALADAELKNASALSSIRATYNSLTASMPSAVEAARAAKEVFTGPTKIALDAAGERVAAAAAQGPPVLFAPVQAAVRAMEAKSPTTIVERALVGAAPEAVSNVGVMASIAANRPGSMVQSTGKLTTEEFKAYVMQQASRAAKELPEEPVDHLPVILGKIRDAEVTELDFPTMHALKRVLDSAVNWDAASRSFNQQMTKGTRKAVREAMAGFAPYDAATAAYESLVNIYRKGVGGKMSRAFRNNPDAVAGLLSPSKPIQAQNLRTLLVDQAAAGGDAQAGQAAWDQARAVYVHQNILNTGIEQLESKLTKLQHAGDFYHTVFGDPSGTAVVGNLWGIVHAYNDVLTRAAESTTAVKQAGQAARTAAVTLRNEATKDAGEAFTAAARAEKTATASKLARAKLEKQNTEAALKAKGAETVRTAKEGAEAKNALAAEGLDVAKAELEKFKATSLGKGATSLTDIAGDVAHVARVGAFTRGTVQALRRLLTGPTGADLLQYMAHSPEWTQRFVRVTQSPYGDRAMSLFMRDLVSAANRPETPPTTADLATPAAVAP